MLGVEFKAVFGEANGGLRDVVPRPSAEFAQGDFEAGDHGGHGDGASAVVIRTAIGSNQAFAKRERGAGIEVDGDRFATSGVMNDRAAAVTSESDGTGDDDAEGNHCRDGGINRVATVLEN